MRDRLMRGDTVSEKTAVAFWAMGIAGVLLFMALAVTGNTLAAQATERENKQANDRLVQCIQTGATASDCRLLIYGSR